MSINTFQERQKAGEIYNNFFNVESENRIDFNLLDTLYGYGAMTEKEFKKISKKLEEIESNLYKKMQNFDKAHLKK